MSHLTLKTLILDREGLTLTVRLHRPKERNAFNSDMIAELTQTFVELDPEIRCVVLTGEGPMFCAGADIRWMKESKTFCEAENHETAHCMATMFKAIDECSAVVIGLVNGLALGGGAGLVACCDMVAARQSASFGFMEVRAGLIPAIVAPYVMRKIGASAVRHYFITSEIFDATAALRLGLVHHVEQNSFDLMQVVHTWRDAILRNSPTAIREVKKLIRTIPEMETEALMQHLAQTAARLRGTPEALEGVNAYLEKRAPVWNK